MILRLKNYQLSYKSWILANDFNRELSSYLSDLNNEDSELEEVEKRLDIINHLKAKYGNTMEEVILLSWKQEKN